MNRKEQARQTRIKILDVFEETLKTKSYENIQVRDICKEAGISIGTFYLYFKNKEEALLTIYREADHSFEIEYQDTPINNIKKIITIYYDLVDMDNLEHDKAVYLAHLKYHDHYFFDEQRPVFQHLDHELSLLTDKHKEITWHILEYCRGNIYNLCIGSSSPENWRHKKVNLTMKYLELLIDNENSDLF